MSESLSLALQKIETYIAATSLLLLLLLSVAQMLLRNILDFGYPEIELINRHLLVLCGMMGAVLATSQASHIKIDALNTVLNARMRNTMKPVLWLFSSLVCGLLCYYAVIFAMDEWQYAPPNERWLLPFSLTYSISFALMSLHFFLLLFHSQEKNEDKILTL